MWKESKKNLKQIFDLITDFLHIIQGDKKNSLKGTYIYMDIATTIPNQPSALCRSPIIISDI